MGEKMVRLESSKKLNDIMSKLEALEVAQFASQNSSRAITPTPASPPSCAPIKVVKQKSTRKKSTKSGVASKATTKRSASKSVSGSSAASVRKPKALARLDTEANQLQSKLGQTEAQLHEVYGDSAIEAPHSHPKVLKLNKTLARVKKKLALVNMKRYKMRQTS